MTAPLPSVGQALDTLAQLGDPDAIAAHLTQLGHRGSRREADCCPVARYVHAETGTDISICSSFWMAWENSSADDYQPVPLQVSKFINRFDRDRYPALIETPTEVTA